MEFNRSLVLIDDRALRREAFTQAEKLIRRLERIERDLDAFESEDQRLYRNWFELTFRIELERIHDTEAEVRRLTHFHNWMVAEHHRLEISVAAAYKILKAEQEFYKTATPSERVQIDRERAARDEFLRTMLEKEYEKQRKRTERAEKKDRAASEAAEQLFREASGLSESEIEERLKNRASAIDWLTSLLTQARLIMHLVVWRKIWEAVPGALKNEFKRLMLHARGMDIESVLNDIEKILSDYDTQQARVKASHSESSMDHNTENVAAPLRKVDLDADSESGSAHSSMEHEADRATSSRQGERDELVKIIYRKLVRRLHPDVNGASTTEAAAWQKAIWHRVQNAHEAFDLDGLERLYRMVLVRSRELSEVTMGEILESHKWLMSEIQELNAKVNANRKSPAWGFSRRKDYDALQRRVVKSVLEELEEMELELRDMQEQFNMLDALSSGEEVRERDIFVRRSQSSSQRRRPSKSSTAAKKPKSRARRRR